MSSANIIQYASREANDEPLTGAFRRLSIGSLLLACCVFILKQITIHGTVHLERPIYGTITLTDRLAGLIYSALGHFSRHARIGTMNTLDAIPLVVAVTIFGVASWHRLRRRGRLPGFALVLTIAGVALIIAAINLHYEWNFNAYAYGLD